MKKFLQNNWGWLVVLAMVIPMTYAISYQEGKRQCFTTTIYMEDTERVDSLQNVIDRLHNTQDSLQYIYELERKNADATKRAMYIQLQSLIAQNEDTRNLCGDSLYKWVKQRIAQAHNG